MIDEEIFGDVKLLSSADRQSPVWRKLKDHFESRLHELRVKNDNDLDVISTAHTRGFIAAIKELLALGDQDPALEVDADE